jgi:hypothetical protein
MPQLQAHGIVIQTSSGWEGRIFRRLQSNESSAQSDVPGKPAPVGEQTFPVAQVATIALAPTTADFASDAVEHLGPNDAIVIIKEYAPRNATQPLFSSVGLPTTLDPDSFDPRVLNRTLAGQAGFQRFFNVDGRAFCLYVVLGAFAQRASVVPRVNAILATVQITPAPGSSTSSTSTTTTAPSASSPTTTPPST